MSRLKCKVAVVTGASRGAGLVLGEEGATVYVTGRSSRGGQATEVHIKKLTIVDGDLNVEPQAMAARHFTHLNSTLGKPLYSPINVIGKVRSRR